ncbi:uncharacterized protein MELLADRAFT_86302 [Melampsora larici-populina 98AG31]|uniref:Uncharacterized protein n=1 Tax=Melampsora larici-populina (strain 98AG31 / pathotype 3-4-7) TaxID=747676 RepID=F4RL93_MELLP|nr:uncharacterized protein MELLADRAFT_86302 [Melampsora larici-populina 98AG31]EGG06868.1 hypothetical protein MELLADRAFT_86302 [Melampsora larici-populina 98AG31]
MEADGFQSTRRRFFEVDDVTITLEKASKAEDDQLFWSKFAAHARNGAFDDMDAFKGLVKAVSIRMERESNGKGLTGTCIEPAFDNFSTTLAAISPQGYRLFMQTYAGRTTRSQRMIRSKLGLKLVDGLASENFDHVFDHLQKLGYTGPVAVGTDETVCVKSLCVSNGMLVGAQGGSIPFESTDELKELVSSIIKENRMCSKIRAYTIQVPLPGVPTYVVALIASIDKQTASDILDLHKKFIELSQKAGFNVLSIGSDGAATEISAQKMLHDSATKYLEFKAPAHNLHIQIPLLGQKLHPVVMVQDPKHARKTAANQLLSGARFISFGCYHVGIPQLAKIVQSDNSTLYIKDVFNTDKQDDGRAYRVFSSETLQLALEHPECTGLSIYLFVLGELCDSWLSRTANIPDRVISAFTSFFFLEAWYEYLEDRQSETKGFILLDKNGISRQSFKIMKQMATSLLALIIAHREYYPDVPLMFWKHGTEACEHIFGWMRIIMPNFTVLDAHQNAPKIHTVAKHIVEGKVKMPKSEHIHSGYQNAFQDFFLKSDEVVSGLKCFPNDLQLRSLIDIAKTRAASLIKFVGIEKCNVNLPDVIDIPPSPQLDDSSESQAEETDTSISVTKRYEVTYEVPLDETAIRDSISEAAHSVEDHQRLKSELAALELNYEGTERREFSATRILIANLLNKDDPI